MLAVALGRPLGTEDTDCDVELPIPIDDANLAAHFQAISNAGGSPSMRDVIGVEGATSLMSGFNALTELHVIIGRILRTVYAVDAVEVCKEVKSIIFTMWIIGLRFVRLLSLESKDHTASGRDTRQGPYRMVRAATIDVQERSQVSPANLSRCDLMLQLLFGPHHSSSQLPPDQTQGPPEPELGVSPESRLRLSLVYLAFTHNQGLHTSFPSPGVLRPGPVRRRGDHPSMCTVRHRGVRRSNSLGGGEHGARMPRCIREGVAWSEEMQRAVGGTCGGGQS